MKTKMSRPGGARGSDRNAGRIAQPEALERQAPPPPMRRSIGQLSSSYAPMRHFAFEGGLGVCLSLPQEGRAMDLDGNTPDQIHRRLREAAQTWFERGYDHRVREAPANAEAFRRLIVDDSLYDLGSGSFEYRRDAFGFMEPKRMAYEIAPTTLVCGTCGLLKPCGSARDMSEFLERAEERCQDPNRHGADPNRCRWRQFEPIFVHPSGSWRSVDVAAMDLFPGSEGVSRRSAACEACGHRQFKVDMSKVTLSGWYLKCAECGVRTSWTWTDNDEDYLNAIRAAVNPGVAAPDPDAARMEKISYGAAIAFVPQAESFVDLPKSEKLRLIEISRFEELCDFIASGAGWLAALPRPADAAAELERGGEDARKLAMRIQRAQTAAKALRPIDPELAAQQDRAAAEAVDEAVAARMLRVQSALPSERRRIIQNRNSSWSSRYDPFQLAVEHAALADTKLIGRMEGGRRAFVRFDAPDSGLRSFEDGSPEEVEAASQVRKALGILGIEEAGLIPKFELCRFTYGYSRTSSGPIHPNRKIPVRLKLFPRVRVGEARDLVHPIYVIRQKNEAFYFRVDGARVRAWLDALDCEDKSLLTSTPSLRAALFASAHPMDRFLTEHDRDRNCLPGLYAATYGLVHTMAHHVIRTMARLSGLDEGGLGEYLFPADLAFVVYRSGMTMDLGDLSSLWRNSWEEFLYELCDHPNSLGCNVGSLCSEQGGACPDCVMIPEVVCIAGTRYLSRSLLTGEGHPSYVDFGNRAILGYLQIGAMSARSGS